MGIPGFGRCPDHQRARVIVIGVLSVLLLLSLGAGSALGASGGEGGTKGWVATDTWRVMNFVVLLVALIFILRKPVSQALARASKISGNSWPAWKPRRPRPKSSWYNIMRNYPNLRAKPKRLSKAISSRAMRPKRKS